MGYYDLVKLLYLADREQVRRRGRTITGDSHWSLPWGPILGNVLDAVRHGNDDAWNDHIRTDKSLKHCALVKDAPPAALSRGDIQTLETIWEAFGQMDGKSLMLYCHSLPEYTDTEGRLPISLEDIARGVGHDEEAIDRILGMERERESIQRFKASLVKTPVHA